MFWVFKKIRERLTALARLAEKAITRHWFNAAWRIRPSLTRALGALKDALDRTLTEHLQQAAPSCLSLKELHAELLGLVDKFPGAELDLGDRTIAVVTESIVLEEVDLGAFKIELDLTSDGRELTYTVIATEPNPAAKSEELTHPHVQSDHLCEGEGRLPIQNALREGRLTDFFQIVTQVLHTYNPAIAYVALDEWDGVSCVSCGATAFEDERTSCSATGETICYECAVTCPDCDQDFAPDLVERCQKCDENYCDRCLEEGICHDCREEIREEEDLAQQQAETPSGGCAGRSADVEQTQAVGPAIG